MPDYGQWIKRRVAMSFHPMPKRAGIMRDGTMLSLRKLGMEEYSVPYSKSMKSQEAKELEAMAQEILEQPDVDYVDPDEFSNT